MAAAVTVLVGQHAVKDLEAARNYYRQVDPDLGAAFLADLDQAMERLQLFPRGAPPVEGFPGLRRARMRRFPYGVFYWLPEPDVLEILRVVNAARDTPKLGV